MLRISPIQETRRISPDIFYQIPSKSSRHTVNYMTMMMMMMMMMMTPFLCFQAFLYDLEKVNLSPRAILKKKSYFMFLFIYIINQSYFFFLSQELRALERYIRRLEFQISKVEELYETYCVQWRLCEGAVNMKRAFALSPSTRASRESLLELGRNHRHSLQDMSVMEGELEILLGELHIKMKGLIGFARLCPGDQYEVVVRLGRQRWRIRGRIESDDTQSWDEEEMVFLPHIHHNFEIKVTEAKGLGWLLVGMVTCASADFFVARSQLMLVDVTELGTIKLQLEVTWNPFDSAEKMRPLSVSRQSVSSRKSSVYSWTAPSTPSFTEKYFIVRTHTHTHMHTQMNKCSYIIKNYILPLHILKLYCLNMLCMNCIPNFQILNPPSRGQRPHMNQFPPGHSCVSEHILSALGGPKRRRALNKLRGRGVAELLPLGRTLRTLAALQIDPNHKVCRAAANCLCRAAGCKTFRSRAVVYYTESLKSSDVQIQHGSCLALKRLRATESVDHIADLWRSTDEDLRSAARETVLSFGKKGFLAFQRMDQLYTEMQEEAYQNQETEITIL
uniref:FAM65 N-terminal domain-containing protein n=1 Tax=Scophthalmus maximus TaxID=52904 RepID=A0A8D3DUU4_SCOMX